MKISPKLKRNFFRIIPFSIIWLLTGWLFLLVEHLATGYQNPHPDEAVTMNIPIFIVASFMLFFVGFLVGLVELVILEKRFRSYSFKYKIAYKLLIYLSMMLAMIALIFPIVTSIELATTPFDPEVWHKTQRFFQSIVFINTAVQLSFHILLSLLYAAISENLGHQVLYNFFTGRYHHPKAERRIFMFLDMKDSTTIAEKLGHTTYFKLLQAYYELMSEPIINHKGEVYQYIGDEVVVTWREKEGMEENNSLNTFFDIKSNFKNHQDYFLEKYGIAPDFKAGIHLGEVTTGEVGALKKEIVFTGDVLNTTARIQSKCKNFNADLLVSEDVYDKLSLQKNIESHFKGDISLKGKKQTVKIFSIQHL